MTLAIMQPYIFPYLGYFQLVQAVDKFVFYDDVNFIKQGWINRNNILLNGSPHLFTIPLEKQSPNNLINEVFINASLYKRWKEKFYKTLEQAYVKAPYYKPVLKLVKGTLETPASGIGDLAKNTVISICGYLGMETEFLWSSSVYQNNDLKSAARVLDICEKEKASRYINAIGGQDLYDKMEFKANGIELSFLKSELVSYPQFKKEFVPYLSIIDVLMFNNSEMVSGHLESYKLI